MEIRLRVLSRVEVDHAAHAFDVDAVLKGRNGGTYAVVRRDGKLLIDGYESDEG